MGQGGVDEGLREPRGKTEELPEITVLVSKAKRKNRLEDEATNRGLNCSLAGKGGRASVIRCYGFPRSGPVAAPHTCVAVPLPRRQYSRPRPRSPGLAQGSRRCRRAASSGLGAASSSGWLTCALRGGPTWPCLLPTPRNNRLLESVFGPVW